MAPALPRQTDSKVSQGLLDKAADKEAAEKAAREKADKEAAEKAATVVQSWGLFSFFSRPNSSSSQQHQVINVAAFEIFNIIISG